MVDSKSSKSAGPGTSAPRAKAKVALVRTNYGTHQRLITYGCPWCGELHRIIELGLRRAACRGGLVQVVVGGGR